MIGRFGHDRVIVERRMHMGQDRPFRLQAVDPVERLLERQMARMISILQGINDENV
ncbi:hypothetical protein D3C87_2103310 [compost metagenome]